jgi:hypothetical protein
VSDRKAAVIQTDRKNDNGVIVDDEAHAKPHKTSQHSVRQWQ